VGVRAFNAKTRKSGVRGRVVRLRVPILKTTQSPRENYSFDTTAEQARCSYTFKTGGPPPSPRQFKTYQVQSRDVAAEPRSVQGPLSSTQPRVLNQIH